MHTLADTRRQDTDDPLMPGRVEQTHAGGQAMLAQMQFLNDGECLVLHLGFDRTAISIQSVQFQGNFLCA